MNRKPKYLILTLGSLLMLSFLLVACGGETSQTSTVNTDDAQENQVMLPEIENQSPAENEVVAEAMDDSYPDPEDKTLTDAYPEPEEQTQEAYPVPEAQAQSATVDEAYPAPNEVAQKPTPRGSDLVATDPATVSLASGQLQLVEMFAFW